MRTVIENRKQIHELHKFDPPPDFWKYCYDPDNPNKCPPDIIVIDINSSYESSGFAESLRHDFFNNNLHTVIENRKQIHEVHKFDPPATIVIDINSSYESSGFAESLRHNFFNSNCSTYNDY